MPASEPTRLKARLNWREIRVVYLRELKGALRERAIVVYSILIPIFLYPLLLWLGLSGVMFVVGQTDNFVSRVVVRNWPEGHPTLRNELERNVSIRFVKETGKVNEKIETGQLEALLEFGPAATSNMVVAGNFEARITYTQAKERSATARGRLVDELDQYRAGWLKREALSRQIDPGAWQLFTVTAQNVASEKQIGSFILGLISPILFVIMVAIGCFYPAVDATAGERERNTWETLMSTAAKRLSVISGKYLYVATLGSAAGVLNLLAMMLTVRPIFGPLFSKAGSTLEFTLQPGAVPITLLAAILLAGFIAAGMMLFASFARTFKEGQAMITPFYMLLMLPALLLQAPGLKFTLPLAFVPIVNVTMMVRDAMSGVFQPAQIAITTVISLLLICACIRLAAFVIQFEDFMAGSFNGSLLKFLRSRRKTQRKL